MTPDEEDRAMASVTSTLASEFPQAAPEELDGQVGRARAAFAGAPIRDYVPIFVLRQARRNLCHRTALPT